MLDDLISMISTMEKLTELSDVHVMVLLNEGKLAIKGVFLHKKLIKLVQKISSLVNFGVNQKTN